MSQPSDLRNWTPDGHKWHKGILVHEVISVGSDDSGARMCVVIAQGSCAVFEGDAVVNETDEECLEGGELPCDQHNVGLRGGESRAELD